MRKILLIVFLFALTLQGFAQQRQGGRFNFAERALLEKDSIYARVTDFSEDQKVIIESIYADFKTSLTKLNEEGLEDRQGLRQKIQVINQEKNQLMKEVLTDAQWTIYTDMQKEFRERRQNRRGNRGERRQRNGN